MNDRDTGFGSTWLRSKPFHPLVQATSFLVLMGHASVAFSGPIEGYLSSFSVMLGSDLGIHASTADPFFDVKIFRNSKSGYRLVEAIDGIPGGLHPIPEMGWLGADWPVSYVLNFPASWQGGLYRIRLLTDDSYINLDVLVREQVPGSHSDILVLDSAPTWIAYNRWGGKSLYWAEDPSEQRAVKVSMKRPGQNAFQQETQEFDRWAHAKEIPIEYASMFDLHSTPWFLDQYNVVVVVGHNEYWTREMRDHFDGFLAGNGHAVILSGNTMWWQIRIEGEQVVCYRTPGNDPLFGVNNNLVTTNWYSYPVNHPENTSIGVSFRNGGYVNVTIGEIEYFPASQGYGGYTVANSDHWVYAHTNLIDGEVFGQSVTIVGYETDGAEVAEGTLEVTGNDGTPLGFVVLGHSEAGSPQGTGLATMGIFQVPDSEGIVFNAATVDWADGLWSMDGYGVADHVVSQMTVNVLSSFSSVTIPVTLDTASLPAGSVGEPYDVLIEAVGGQAPYTWSISAGSWPSGLNLDPNTGRITGVPTQVGRYQFDVFVTDQMNTSTTARRAIMIDHLAPSVLSIIRRSFSR